MMKLHKSIVFSILFYSSLNYAAEEKLPSLDIMQVCEFTLAYTDKGSGGEKDVAIYTPRVPNNYFMIGGYAQGNYTKPNQCVIAVKPSTLSSDQPAPLLIEPANWRLIWADNGSGAKMDGSIWQAVSPDANYICVGSVGQTGYNKPRIPNYRCLHKCLLQGINISGQIEVPMQINPLVSINLRTATVLLHGLNETNHLC